MNELTDLAKKNAIAALEIMKEEEDRGAETDGPNAGWHYKNADENKKIIEEFLELLRAESYGSMKTLVLDAIIKESIKTGMRKE